MIAYASRTGTKRNLDALRVHGWRLLVSAEGAHRNEGFPYALDNGAWTAFTHGKPINLRKFETLLRKMGAQADWTALPDIVSGGLASLELSLQWMRRVLDESPRAMLPVQPGFRVEDVEPLLGPRVGVFIGGDTKWKLTTMPLWAAAAARRGAWCHVARVNSQKRILMASAAGAHSFDGSGPSRFAVETPKLDHARRQLGLFTGEIE